MTRHVGTWTDAELLDLFVLVPERFTWADVHRALQVRYGSRVPHYESVMRRWRDRSWMYATTSRKRLGGGGQTAVVYAKGTLLDLDAWGL